MSDYLGVEAFYQLLENRCQYACTVIGIDSDGEEITLCSYDCFGYDRDMEANVGMLAQTVPTSSTYE